MEVSSNSMSKNRLVESLLNKDLSSFNKYLQESIQNTEQSLILEYSKKIKEELNG